jgi:integrase
LQVQIQYWGVAAFLLHYIPFVGATGGVIAMTLVSSVSRRRGCKIWSAFFRDLDGRQRCRSTGTDNKHAALVIANEYELVARQKKTLRQIRRTLEGLRELVSGEATPSSTLRQVASGWLATKRPETAPATHAFYCRSVKKLLVALAQKADLPVSDITRNDLVRYRNAMATALKAHTVNQNLKVVRMIFKLARKDGLIADDPSEFVDTVKAKGNGPAKRLFRLDELRAVLEVADPVADPGWRSMVLFGLYTGQRLGDVASLRWANIDLPGQRIRLTTRKTGKILAIPLAEPLQRHVLSLPVSDDARAPLHPRALAVLQAQGKTGGLSNQFADLLAQAGLRAPVRRTKADAKTESSGLSFHSLRHTATTLLHEGGVPAAVAQALIGHDSEAIHQVYVSVSFEALKKAADALPDVT